MIAEYFYIPPQVVREFYAGRFKHYATRPRVTVVKKYKYTMRKGDTLYSLAEQVFGKDQQSMWYIIADCNPLREVDSWEEDDVIFLPELIVKETPVDSRRTSSRYSQAIVFPKASTNSTAPPISGETVPPVVINTTFISLPDTPLVYQKLKILRTNSTGDAVEFIDEGAIDHNLLLNYEPARHMELIYDPYIKAYLISA